MVEQTDATIIQFNGVSKTFAAKNSAHEVKAVQDVSFSVKRGEIFGVIGYSGAGKSTLIRMVNGLETPTRGRVIVNNRNVASLNSSDLQQLRHRIGMIFQNYNLLKTATVYQNIFLPLKLEKIPKDEIKTRVEKYLKIVGLWDRRDSYPNQLSGGQRQRVAIARALAHEPNVLLSDEATSALDPETTESILTLLQDINKKLGITIFLITHELEVVREVCDRVALMDQGNLIEIGNTIDIFTHPKNEITKRFLGASDSLGVPKDLLASEGKDNRLLLLQFVGEQAKKPIIATLSDKFHVKPNILAGSISYLKGKPFGKLLISLDIQDQEMLKKEIDYIQDQGVVVKEVNSYE
ncbi:methionine import ATP-binding protein MetN 1 [Lentilactobacillus fungorum]|uniref:Methionine import ATP-binding protein MetN 1 n=1 Tax=Lentilactobacillus fungorum TaxID=2201250 RepID=A0ABQ3W2M0_9LACO|nr:ATP-binding cassette domain-containing protein [Lentilactobacillus fungorum]GHP13899.1 methionine import ATP-binding protein MetN 1 [Lentilactobacillus fungorum]